MDGRWEGAGGGWGGWRDGEIVSCINGTRRIITSTVRREGGRVARLTEIVDNDEICVRDDDGAEENDDGDDDDDGDGREAGDICCGGDGRRGGQKEEARSIKARCI